MSQSSVKMVKCPHCRGTGKLGGGNRSDYGLMFASCMTCHGTGVVESVPELGSGETGRAVRWVLLVLAIGLFAALLIGGVALGNPLFR